MSTRIAKIHITNFKAINQLDADFNGCTAIIVGGNNRGKSSFLKGIPDRIRGEKPEMVVTIGETNGKGVLELTTGERFEWEFDTSGKDKLIYISAQGIKTGVTKEIAKKFFPELFDIDKFIEAQPKEKSKMLQKICGIDLTEIDARYKNAYDERTLANRRQKEQEAKATVINMSLPTELVDTSAMEQELGGVESHNKLYTEAQSRHEENEKSVTATDKEITELEKKLKQLRKSLAEKQEKVSIGDAWLKDAANQPKTSEELASKISDAKQRNELIRKNNEARAASDTLLQLRQHAESADLNVKSIELEKEELLKSSSLPEGIAISEDGITVDGLPLERNQISTSKLYCTALRMASLNLGTVRTLHFDASPLDRNTLDEIQKWAQSNDLQLLIERPDFDGGEIKYELMEESTEQVTA